MREVKRRFRAPKFSSFNPLLLHVAQNRTQNAFNTTSPHHATQHRLDKYTIGFIIKLQLHGSYLLLLAPLVRMDCVFEAHVRD